MSKTCSGAKIRVRRARNESLKWVRWVRVAQHLQIKVHQQGNVQKNPTKKIPQRKIPSTKVAFRDCVVLRITSKGPSPTHTTRARKPLVQSECSYLKTIVWLICAVVCRWGAAPETIQWATQREKEKKKERRRRERRKGKKAKMATCCQGNPVAIARITRTIRQPHSANLWQIHHIQVRARTQSIWDFKKHRRIFMIRESQQNVRGLHEGKIFENFKVKMEQKNWRNWREKQSQSPTLSHGSWVVARNARWAPRLKVHGAAKEVFWRVSAKEKISTHKIENRPQLLSFFLPSSPFSFSPNSIFVQVLVKVKARAADRERQAPKRRRSRADFSFRVCHRGHRRHKQQQHCHTKQHTQRAPPHGGMSDVKSTEPTYRISVGFVNHKLANGSGLFWNCHFKICFNWKYL